LTACRRSLHSLQEALEQAGFEIPYATLQLYSDGAQTLEIVAPDLKLTSGNRSYGPMQDL